MKKFEIYRNIRKQAMIFGLPIALFALMMISIIASLLVIIFSFSFVMVLGVFVCNTVLYAVLIKISSNAQLLQFSSVFPKIISNKKITVFDYDEG